MIHCFYHKNDLDGKCSGAIVKFHEPDAKLIGIDYGEDIDWNAIGNDDIVYMVDFALQPYAELMPKLEEKCKTLIWIDHHKTAVDWAKSVNFECTGVQDISRAGCELTWKYFHRDSDFDAMPVTILWLGIYDSWRNEDKKLWDGKIMPFQYGMRVIDNEPDSKIWKTMFQFKEEDLGFQAIKVSGMGILTYQSMIDKKVMEDLSYEIEWEGHKCLVCNSVMSNSQFFVTKWDKSKYDLMISYKHVKGEHYTISFYTDKEGIDGSVIAKKYGGGGHVQASGCQVKELPWRINDGKAPISE